MMTHAHHHRLIRDLVAAIRDLRAHLSELQVAAEYEAEARECRTERENEIDRQLDRARAEVREAERREQERQYAYDDAVQAMERARRSGDEYAEQRALRRLREL